MRRCWQRQWLSRLLPRCSHCRLLCAVAPRPTLTREALGLDAGGGEQPHGPVELTRAPATRIGVQHVYPVARFEPEQDAPMGVPSGVLAAHGHRLERHRPTRSMRNEFEVG